jgi:acyl-CoA thioesterase YciA
MTIKHLSPKGELVIRTIAMPKDTNANGDIFGGWLVSQMDLGGAILARQICQGRVATVAIDKMSFIRPVNVGDIVCCYAELIKVGRTSMQILVEVWSYPQDILVRQKVTEGIFTFVAIDEQGKPRPVY